MKVQDIRERTFVLAVRVVKLCRYLENNADVSKTLIRQLIRAGTSVGANLEEAQAGQSRADFISKNSIALKEARETNYWLRLILETTDFEEKAKHGVDELIAESIEITKIIAAIVVSAKQEK